MATGITITVSGTDRTQVIPFSDGPDGTKSWISFTETVPGIATATMGIYDLTNSITVARLAPIVVHDVTTGRNIFNGWVQKRKYSVVANYRLIELSCVDLNAALDTTLVGTPTGTSWVPDATGSSYTAVDPYSYIQGGSDAGNVRYLFLHYWQGPVAVNTTDYVETTNPSVASPEGVWFNATTLKGALDNLAALSGPFITYWIDADAYLHWTNVPQVGAPTGGSPYHGGTAPYTYTTGSLPKLFPQVSYTINGGGAQPAVPPAPYNISDHPDGVTSIPYENFSVEYDDAGAADALYANAATSFTYTPPADPPTSGVFNFSFSPTPGYDSLPPETNVSTYGYYILTATGTVTAYGVTNPGTQQPYVNLADTVSVPAGTYYVNQISLFSSSNSGAIYWQIVDIGAYNLYCIPQASPLVTTEAQAAVATPGSPGGGYVWSPGEHGKFGIGATGWVNKASPTWLSRYIDLPDAQNTAQRDAKGGIALTYMGRSVVRGTADVVYPGILYRAGMGLTVTNTPIGMSELYMVMRVTTTFLSGEDYRRAALEWGTAPLGSIGLRRQAANKPPVKTGASEHRVATANTNPMPGSTITLYTQLVNAQGEPWKVAGKKVTWTVTVYDTTGADVTAASAGGANGWALIPSNTSQTDAHGGTSVILQVAKTVGYRYKVNVTSPD